jgi:hypothetical protein
MKWLLLSLICASALLGVASATAEAGPPKKPTNKYGWPKMYNVTYKQPGARRWSVVGQYTYAQAHAKVNELARKGISAQIESRR